MKRLLVTALFSLTLSAAASEREPLPEPLTLDYALSLADRLHPALRLSEAAWLAAQADEQAAEAEQGLKLMFQGRLRWTEPSNVSPYQEKDDHQATLRLSKELYDFGRSDARRAAVTAEQRAARARYMDTRRQRRIAIIERFFDVLLADKTFARDNEAMAVAFVNLNRLRNRSELGQVSDIELLEMEEAYQAVRRQHARSSAGQRASRAHLALALNRPGQLSANLAMPELPQLERQRPEYEELLKRARENNPVLKAQRAKLEAARLRLDAARAGGRPRIHAEVEAHEYSHLESGSDQWRAGVFLNMPLYDGTVAADQARAQAAIYRAQAELEQSEREIAQTLLELWLELDGLAVEQDVVFAQQDYRDLYLERSRANYEMEVKSDLGDAMVRLSEAQLAAAHYRFRVALTWEKIDALIGAALPEASE